MLMRLGASSNAPLVRDMCGLNRVEAGLNAIVTIDSLNLLKPPTIAQAVHTASVTREPLVETTTGARSCGIQR